MPPLRFCYQTLEFDDMDIHVRTLRDKQQYDDSFDEDSISGLSDANWSLFGVIWPSGKVLADLMQDYNVEKLKILEIGCGIGLSSLILNHRNANITTTDINPNAKEFLDENTRINKDDKIPFFCTNWDEEKNDLGIYDLIIASDVLYEHFYLKNLADFLNNHTKKDSKVIVVDPGRGNSNKFSKLMLNLGFNFNQYKPKDTEKYLDEPFKGTISTFLKS